jgi:hypothetical protein
MAWLSAKKSGSALLMRMNDDFQLRLHVVDLFRQASCSVLCLWPVCSRMTSNGALE